MNFFLSNDLCQNDINRCLKIIDIPQNAVKKFDESLKRRRVGLLRIFLASGEKCRLFLFWYLPSRPNKFFLVSL